MMPALLMSASMRPVCFRIWDTRSAVFFCVPLPRSALAATNPPPASLTFAPVSLKSPRATPTTFAPSRANARVLAFPMPRLAPVTMATLLLKRFVSIICAFYLVRRGEFHEPQNFFLSGRRRAPPSGKSPQIHRLHAVHVIEHLIFPGHAPDELVIARAAAAMDGPVHLGHGRGITSS